MLWPKVRVVLLRTIESCHSCSSHRSPTPTPWKSRGLPVAPGQPIASRHRSEVSGSQAVPHARQADAVSCASAEGLHGAGGAAAAGRGALAGLHHLPVRGVRHHAQQHRRALPRARLPHLHLPQGGKSAPLPRCRASERRCRVGGQRNWPQVQREGCEGWTTHKAMDRAAERNVPTLPSPPLPAMLLFVKASFLFIGFTKREIAPQK